MNFLVTLLILIIILSLIVFIHEFGHFISAKKRGIYVHEFAIGMGPKIFSFKRKNDETIYSLRIFPLGGFNAIAMSEGDFKIDKNRTLEHKKYWEKILVLSMGIIFNLILTIVLLFINGLIYGSPNNTPIIGEVITGSASDTAGLNKGDKILKIGDKKVETWDDVLLEINYIEKDEKTYTFVVERDEKIYSFNVTPLIEVNEKGEESKIFGFSTSTSKDTGLLAAVKYSITGFKEMFVSLFKILGNLFTGKIGLNNLSGPVGVYNVIDQVKASGLETIIYLTAYISVNVGIINLLPFPAFDGGRILIYTIEKIKGKKLNPKFETILNNIGMVLLILLFVYVTFNDILKLF